MNNPPTPRLSSTDAVDDIVQNISTAFESGDTQFAVAFNHSGRTVRVREFVHELRERLVKQGIVVWIQQHLGDSPCGEMIFRQHATRTSAITVEKGKYIFASEPVRIVVVFERAAYTAFDEQLPESGTYRDALDADLKRHWGLAKVDDLLQVSSVSYWVGIEHEDSPFQGNPNGEADLIANCIVRGTDYY